MSWDGFVKEWERGPLHFFMAFWKLGLIIAVVLTVTIGGCYVILRPASLVGDVLDRENVKSNYEWFKEQHEAINSIDVKIKIAAKDVARFKREAGPRAKWKREDKNEAARKQSILSGLEQHRADLAAKYNARSRMVNRAIFKGNDTPERIPVEGEKTK